MGGRVTRSWWHGAVLGVIAAVVTLAACRDGSSAQAEGGLRLAPESALPDHIRRAPTTVVEAYRFAVANAEVLNEIPCHCGCGAMGHTSNAACYLMPGSQAGAVGFDDHALGCTLCVDITHDVMRMLREGRQVPEIRAYIETTYGRYGPSNLP